MFMGIMIKIRKKYAFFCINHIYCGTKPRYFERKRKLLVKAGYKIGENTKIVGPVLIQCGFECGKNCWIGRNLCVNGNGFVKIGDNCDIGPEVTFQTGGHLIGSADRRAGEGVSFEQSVGSGTWIGGRATILGKTDIGKSSVIAGCACVVKDVPENCVVGGVPAKVIKEITDER